MAGRPALRLNGRAHELIVRRTRAGASVELRRKQDGVALAHGAGVRRVDLAAHPSAHAEAQRALRALAPLAASAGLALALRARKAIERPSRGVAIAPLLARIPRDYGAQRGLARTREPRVLASVG